MPLTLGTNYIYAELERQNPKPWRVGQLLTLRLSLKDQRMSVRIHWRQHKVESKYFEGGTSTSLERLQRVFGGCIKAEDALRLRAMSIAADDPFYEEVAEIVKRFGTIEFWGEH